jgi:CDP-diacylglycerol--glycerol-3-phosphate 3-phosphatidyltransferase
MRAIASAGGWTIPASELGKTKMVFQVVAITVIVLERRLPLIRPLGEVLLWMVVVFALASAAQYFWLFWKRLDAGVKRPASSRNVVVLSTDEKEPEEKDVAAH